MAASTQKSFFNKTCIVEVGPNSINLNLILDRSPHIKHFVRDNVETLNTLAPNMFLQGCNIYSHGGATKKENNIKMLHFLCFDFVDRSFQKCKIYRIHNFFLTERMRSNTIQFPSCIE